MGENTNDLHNQISSILDKNNKEHQILSLMAKIIDTQISHQNNNLRSMQREIHNQLTDISKDIEQLKTNNEERIDEQDKKIDGIKHDNACPYDMKTRVDKLHSDMEDRISKIEELIDIFKLIKKYKWVSILAFIGICSLLGLGASDVISAVKALSLIK